MLLCGLSRFQRAPAGSDGFQLWFPIGSGEVSLRLSLNLVSMCFGGGPMGFVGFDGFR
jgi:hypothetical protein